MYSTVSKDDLHILNSKFPAINMLQMLITIMCLAVFERRLYKQTPADRKKTVRVNYNVQSLSLTAHSKVKLTPSVNHLTLETSERGGSDKSDGTMLFDN